VQALTTNENNVFETTTSHPKDQAKCGVIVNAEALEPNVTDTGVYKPTSTNSTGFAQCAANSAKPANDKNISHRAESHDKGVFESEPVPSCADWRCDTDAPISADGQKHVFESKPRLSIADVKCGVELTNSPQDKGVFESEPVPSCADWRCDTDAPISADGQKHVFESKPRLSIADVKCGVELTNSPQDKGVFESEPVPSCADWRCDTDAPISADGEKHVFESKPRLSIADVKCGVDLSEPVPSCAN